MLSIKLRLKYSIGKEKTVVHLKTPQTAHQLKELIHLAIWCAERLGASKEDINEAIEKAKLGETKELLEVISAFLGAKGIKHTLE